MVDLYYVVKSILETQNASLLACLSGVFGRGNRRQRWWLVKASSLEHRRLHSSLVVKCGRVSEFRMMYSNESYYFQEHFADISHAVCYVLPGLSVLLLPRLNALSLLAFLTTVACVVTHW